MNQAHPLARYILAAAAVIFVVAMIRQEPQQESAPPPQNPLTQPSMMPSEETMMPGGKAPEELHRHHKAMERAKKHVEFKGTFTAKLQMMAFLPEGDKHFKRALQFLRAIAAQNERDVGLMTCVGPLDKTVQEAMREMPFWRDHPTITINFEERWTLRSADGTLRRVQFTKGEGKDFTLADLREVFLMEYQKTYSGRTPKLPPLPAQ